MPGKFDIRTVLIGQPNRHSDLLVREIFDFFGPIEMSQGRGHAPGFADTAVRPGHRLAGPVVVDEPATFVDLRRRLHGKGDDQAALLQGDGFYGDGRR